MVDISKSGRTWPTTAWLDQAYAGLPDCAAVLRTIFFHEAIKVLDETLKAFEKKLETAKQRYDAGLASSFDVNLLQVQISSVQGQRLDFLNNIDKFRIAFNTLTGREADAAFDPDGVFVFEPGVSTPRLVQGGLGESGRVQQCGTRSTSTSRRSIWLKPATSPRSRPGLV